MAMYAAMCWDVLVQGVEQEIQNEKDLAEKKLRVSNSLGQVFEELTSEGKISYDDRPTDPNDWSGHRFPGNVVPNPSTDIKSCSDLVMEYLGEQAFKDMPYYAPQIRKTTGSP